MQAFEHFRHFYRKREILIFPSALDEEVLGVIYDKKNGGRIVQQSENKNRILNSYTYSIL